MLALGELCQNRMDVVRVPIDIRCIHGIS